MLVIDVLLTICVVAVHEATVCFANLLFRFPIETRTTIQEAVCPELVEGSVWFDRLTTSGYVSMAFFMRIGINGGVRQGPVITSVKHASF